MVKNPKTKITTVDEILTLDDVKDLISRLIKNKSKITCMIAIYEDSSGNIEWQVTSGLEISQVMLMLEVCKKQILGIYE